MTIVKTHTGTVITKDGPKVKKLHQTERMWVVGKNEFYHKETGRRQFLKRNGFKVCFHDRFIAVTSTGEQPDAMGFRNSASCLIEAKCSRADLLADRKKRFRKNPSLGMGDWRFFISEPGIISIEDLPPGWGLLHVVNGRVRKVHGWPKGNCCWGNPDDKPFTGNKQVECDYMLSALRRMELRGHLNEIYDGVIVNKKEGNAA